MPRTTDSYLRRRRRGMVAAVAACAAAMLLTQCDPEEPTVRTWATSGGSEKVNLSTGALNFDKDFHDVVKKNYAGYADVVARILRDKHLFNPSGTPMEINFFLDAEEYGKFAPQPGQPSCFDPEGLAVFLHAGGQQLVDAGQSRRLVGHMAQAVLQDMFQGDCPAWLAVGLVNLLQDGSVGPSRNGAKKDGNPETGDAFDWFVGVPDVNKWRAIGKPGILPPFDQVRVASPKVLSQMGAAGELVATAAVYLLHQLKPQDSLVWQIRTKKVSSRDPESVLKVMKEFDPRYGAHFENPVASFLKMRPDIKEYLESEMAGHTSMKRSRANVNANDTVGAYWWQFAKYAFHYSLTDDAIKALEKCRACDPHRDLGAALAKLAEVYLEQKKWKELKDVVQQQFGTSVVPTPTMYLMLAEATRDSNPADAKKTVQLGLQLPGEGFESAMARLKELAEELKSGN